MGTGPHPPLRVLMLLPFPPRSDAGHGGARATAELVLHLAERHRVHAVYVLDPHDAPPDDEIRERCAALVGVPRSRPKGSVRGRLVRRVRRALGPLRGRPSWVEGWWLPEFVERAREIAAQTPPDIVQAEFSVMGQYLRPVAPGGTPRVLTIHEPGAAAAAERLAGARGAARLRSALEARAWQRFERRILADADAAVALTNEDMDALRTLVDPVSAPRLARIPIGVRVHEAIPASRRTEAPILLFVGSFIHPPNRDAALRLVTSIFPRIREAVPSAELRVVGASPPVSLSRAAGPGVEFLGYVPDLGPLYRDAAIVMAPVRTGGGMRVKVLEAFARGRPLVATRRAAAGLEVRGGTELLLAETDGEFAEAAIALLGNPEWAEAVGRAGWRWAREHASWAATVERYEELYRELLSR